MEILSSVLYFGIPDSMSNPKEVDSWEEKGRQVAGVFYYFEMGSSKDSAGLKVPVDQADLKRDPLCFCLPLLRIKTRAAMPGYV